MEVTDNRTDRSVASQESAEGRVVKAWRAPKFMVSEILNTRNGPRTPSDLYSNLS